MSTKPDHLQVGGLVVERRHLSDRVGHRDDAETRVVGVLDRMALRIGDRRQKDPSIGQRRSAIRQVIGFHGAIAQGQAVG